MQYADILTMIDTYYVLVFSCIGSYLVNEIITKCYTVIGFPSHRIYCSVEFTIHWYNIIINYRRYVYKLLL